MAQTGGLCSMSQVQRALLFIVVANRDLPECGLHDYNLTREELLCVCGGDWRRVSLFYFTLTGSAWMYLCRFFSHLYFSVQHLTSGSPKCVCVHRSCRKRHLLPSYKGIRLIAPEWNIFILTIMSSQESRERERQREEGNNEWLCW